MGRTVWYPGHMAKGKRHLEGLVGMLDVVVEVRDARAPRLTASPLLENIPDSILVWTVLSKRDLADPEATRLWLEYFEGIGRRSWAVDLRTGVPDSLSAALASLRPTSSSKRTYRETRAAVVGTPNVGKSSLLNKLVGRKAAAVGAIPGVTRGVAWFRGRNCLIVDSPGILDPHSDARAHRMLAWISGTKGQIISSWQTLACECLAFLGPRGLNELLTAAWGIDCDGEPLDVLTRIGRRLGKLLPGAVVDLEAAGKMMIESLASGKLGKITIERPGEPVPWSTLP